MGGDADDQHCNPSPVKVCDSHHHHHHHHHHHGGHTDHGWRQLNKTGFEEDGYVVAAMARLSETSSVEVES